MFSRPPTNILSTPVFNSNDFITANSIDPVAATGSDLLKLNNNLIAVNLFQSLPICTQVPTSNAQVVNKLYTDSNFGSLTNANSFAGVNNFQKITESVVSASGTANPFTIDYSAGNIYFIPRNYNLTTNFQLIITNIPTDTTKSYTVSVIYQQSSTSFICSTARVSNTSGVFLLGTASTYAAPLFNGGIPTLTASPNLIIQTFIISSIANSSGTYLRYVLSSVSNFY
jgi:hypothetical protein